MHHKEKKNGYKEKKNGYEDMAETRSGYFTDRCDLDSLDSVYREGQRQRSIRNILADRKHERSPGWAGGLASDRAGAGSGRHRRFHDSGQYGVV
jgi:hypothetical protein